MLGGLLFGSLSDRWGRKPFMLLSLYMHVGVGVAIAFAPNYLTFAALRFIMGVLMQVSHIAVHFELNLLSTGVDLGGWGLWGHTHKILYN